MEKSDSVKVETNQKEMRARILYYTKNTDYVSASFWAKQYMLIAGKRREDQDLLAVAFYNSGDYVTAIKHFIGGNYDQTNLKQRLNIAKCYYAMKGYASAEDMVDVKLVLHAIEKAPWVNKVLAEMKVLQGKIALAVNQAPETALEHFKAALLYDIYCYQALEEILKSDVESSEAKMVWIKSLRFQELCTNGDWEFIRKLYKKNVKEFPEVAVILKVVPFPPYVPVPIQDNPSSTSLTKAVAGSSSSSSAVRPSLAVEMSESVADVDNHEPIGFKFASGKEIHISQEALAIATEKMSRNHPSGVSIDPLVPTLPTNRKRKLAGLVKPEASKMPVKSISHIPSTLPENATSQVEYDINEIEELAKDCVFDDDDNFGC